MSDSKDYNTAGNAITGAENSNLSGDSRIGSGSGENSTRRSASNGSSADGSDRKSSSSKSSRRKSSKSSSSSDNSGSRSSKFRSNIKTGKKLFFLGIYAVLMLLTVRRMMDEQLLRSFWLNLAAFGLLWIYYVLSSQKITKVFKISKAWFQAHALVVLTHLAVAIFLGDVDPNAGMSQPVHEQKEAKPVVKPYQVGE